MSPLRPCIACARHVRASEATCPFCAASLPVEAPVAPALGVGRLGRAAMFVAGTAVLAAAATGVTACGEKRIPNHQKPYGAPPADPVWV